MDAPVVHIAQARRASGRAHHGTDGAGVPAEIQAAPSEKESSGPRVKNKRSAQGSKPLFGLPGERHEQNSFVEVPGRFWVLTHLQLQVERVGDERMKLQF